MQVVLQIRSFQWKETKALFDLLERHSISEWQKGTLSFTSGHCCLYYCQSSIPSSSFTYCHCWVPYNLEPFYCILTILSRTCIETPSLALATFTTMPKMTKMSIIDKFLWFERDFDNNGHHHSFRQVYLAIFTCFLGYCTLFESSFGLLIEIGAKWLIMGKREPGQIQLRYQLICPTMGNLPVGGQDSKAQSSQSCCSSLWERLT